MSDLTRIEKKLDTLSDKMGEMTVQLEVNTHVLEEHHKRSLYLEKRNEEIESRIIPIEDHVKFLNTLGKLVLLVGGLSGAILATIKLLG